MTVHIAPKALHNEVSVLKNLGQHLRMTINKKLQEKVLGLLSRLVLQKSKMLADWKLGRHDKVSASGHLEQVLMGLAAFARGFSKVKDHVRRRLVVFRN